MLKDKNEATRRNDSDQWVNIKRNRVAFNYKRGERGDRQEAESAVSNRLRDRESSTEIENRKENRKGRRDLEIGADLQFLLVFEKMYILIIDALVPKWHGIRMTHEPLEAPL